MSDENSVIYLEVEEANNNHIEIIDLTFDDNSDYRVEAQEERILREVDAYLENRVEPKVPYDLNQFVDLVQEEEEVHQLHGTQVLEVEEVVLPSTEILLQGEEVQQVEVVQQGEVPERIVVLHEEQVPEVGFVVNVDEVEEEEVHSEEEEESVLDETVEEQGYDEVSVSSTESGDLSERDWRVRPFSREVTRDLHYYWYKQAKYAKESQKLSQEIRHLLRQSTDQREVRTEGESRYSKALLLCRYKGDYPITRRFWNISKEEIDDLRFLRRKSYGVYDNENSDVDFLQTHEYRPRVIDLNPGHRIYHQVGRVQFSTATTYIPITSRYTPQLIRTDQAEVIQFIQTRRGTKEERIPSTRTTTRLARKTDIFTYSSTGGILKLRTAKGEADLYWKARTDYVKRATYDKRAGEVRQQIYRELLTSVDDWSLVFKPNQKLIESTEETEKRKLERANYRLRNFIAEKLILRIRLDNNRFVEAKEKIEQAWRRYFFRTLGKTRTIIPQQPIYHRNQHFLSDYFIQENNQGNNIN